MPLDTPAHARRFLNAPGPSSCYAATRPDLPGCRHEALRKGALMPGHATAQGRHYDWRARQVLRVDLGADEWMLVAPPSGGSAVAAMRRLAAGLAARRRPPAAAGAGLLVRAPDLDPRIGAAVLHAAGDAATIYAPAGQIAHAAATWLSLLAGRAGILSGGDDAGPAPPVVAVTRVPHADLMEPVAGLTQRGSPVILHPVAVHHAASATDILVCEDLVSAELAGAIERLCTAHARLVRSRQP